MVIDGVSVLRKGLDDDDDDETRNQETDEGMELASCILISYGSIDANTGTIVRRNLTCYFIHL